MEATDTNSKPVRDGPSQTQNTRKTRAKRIVYYPPSRQAVQEFARKVCERLGERDASFLAPEVVSGLAKFIELAAKITAKHLNEESERENKLDNKTD